MNHDKMSFQDTASLYSTAAILRLALFTFFPALPDLLTGRVEVSTPVTSFKRCKTDRQTDHFPLHTLPFIVFDKDKIKINPG
jgi:hypothetical protein